MIYTPPAGDAINLDLREYVAPAGDSIALALDGVALYVSPSSLVAGSTGTSVTLTGVGTGWTAGTPGTPTFGISTTGSGASITAQTVASSTSATLTIDAGTTGTITITDPDSGATATITVAAASTGIPPRHLPRALARGLSRAAA